MKTGSFFTYRGQGGISIARRTPEYFRGPQHRGLAPGPWFRDVDKPTYEKLFKEQMLDQLDPKLTVASLHQMVPEGVEPVLLCWERPPFHAENWCHRRMVAFWLFHELDVLVDEYEKPPPPPPPQMSLF